ncbi:MULTISPECIES: hypothetical protein [Pseudoalteromonas]|uniref:hypothetical protein n=1 Tax=Pseudoalteromonas TaxID=53246 RepID=UPI00272B7E92|nr:hypothetical protein [Pseudoalteromonas sp.]
MRYSKLDAEIIRKVLQLRGEAKSVGVISKSLRISKSTAHKVITSCDSALSKKKLQNITDDELLTLVYQRVEPDFEQLYYLDIRNKASVKSLYTHYLKHTKGKTYGYTTFLKKYKDWSKSSPLPKKTRQQYGVLNCEYVVLKNAALDTETGELKKAVIFFAQQTLTDNILVGICEKNDYSTLFAMLVYACHNASESVIKVDVRFHNSVFNSINNDLAANFQSLQGNKIQIVKRISRRTRSPFLQLRSQAQEFSNKYCGKISSFCPNFISYCQQQGYIRPDSSINEITSTAILKSKAELPLTRLKTFKVNKAQLATIAELNKVISLPMELTGKKVRVAYDDNRAIVRTPDNRTVIHHFHHPDNSYRFESMYSSTNSKYYINPEHLPVTEAELKMFGSWIAASFKTSEGIHKHLHSIVCELLNKTEMPQLNFSLVNYLINMAKDKPKDLLDNALNEWVNDELSSVHELIKQLNKRPRDSMAFD